jgi:hypothetical protein
LNKKRKILTVVALAVFSVIIVARYHGLPQYEAKHNYVYVQKIGEDTDWISKYHGKILSRTSSRFDPQDEDIEIEWPGWLRLNNRLLDDVRMPLFVLAVFYAGLFAILGDNKRKEQ